MARADTLAIPLRHGAAGVRCASVTALDGEAALAWHRARGAVPAARVTALLERQGVADARALSLGDRERLLLALHAEAFGPGLALVAACRACDALVEFDLAPEALRGGEAEAREGRVAGAGRHLRVRAPGGAEAETAASATDPAAALAAACLPDGGTPSAAERVVLAAEVARRDPEAAVVLALTCPTCGDATACIVDGATLLDARLPPPVRLMEAVDILARSYGWSEAAVLALPLARLPGYLALAQRAA